MPCFKGLAVSIHSDGCLPEYAVQKQSRQNRISSYIAVPPARVHKDSLTGKPEQPPFAISITLLTPGLHVPYSTPEPTEDDPYPRARMVGGLPTTYGEERGRYGAVVTPYVPQTQNPNETIAAYIYFDGRPKEEVATLLRKGEETWVNSRWVSTGDGGLAEREFLFREVGLERWLNGLDLEGSKDDKAKRIEKRQARMEKRRKRRREAVVKREDGEGDVKIKMEDVDGMDAMQDDANFSSLSDESDEDDAPEPEAAGQIKVALFRVLASGEIKRGEYSPQFDAHDDDDGGEQNGNGEAGADEDVDHTTSFAKPKTLDPKSISTQTVTGLDPPELPYAVFTFFYRGEKQLRKMRIFPGSDAEQTPASTKRKASGPDFSYLGPLNKFGTVGFSGYRDTANTRRKTRSKAADGDAMESDNEEEEEERVNEQDDADGKQENGGLLSPEDARRQEYIAEGVQKIKLKRQHSADPMTADSALHRKSPHLTADDSPSASTPASVNSTSANAGTPPLEGSKAPTSAVEASEVIGSPFKKHRASMPGLDGAVFAPLGAGAESGFVPPTSAPTVSQSGSFGGHPAVAASTGQTGGDIDDDDEEFHSRLLQWSDTTLRVVVERPILLLKTRRRRPCVIWEATTLDFDREFAPVVQDDTPKRLQKRTLVKRQDSVHDELVADILALRQEHAELEKMFFELGDELFEPIRSRLAQFAGASSATAFTNSEDSLWCDPELESKL